MFQEIDYQLLLSEDPATLARFLDGLEGLVFGIAEGRYRFRRDESEDILLEVLRKLWDADKAALNAWRGEGSLSTYLSAIVHRFCLMELRRRSRRVTEQPTEALDNFEAGTEASPLLRQERLRLYREAASELAPRDRRLLQMRFKEDRDYPAIMSELGLSHGAARKAVHGAVQRLREKLREIAPELFASKASP